MIWRTLGFSDQKQYFTRLAATGELGHAYILSGPALIGKRTFGLELAEKLNANVLLVDATDSTSGQTIGIDAIRRVKNFSILTPLAGRGNFILIDNAEQLTEEAQNAFLKLLEEPSARTTFLLVTQDPTTLLPTITSRCQVVNFQLHPARLMAMLFADVRIDQARKEFLLRIAAGRPGLIKTVLAQDNGTEVVKAAEQLDDLVKAGLAKRLTLAQQLIEQSADQLPQLVFYWLLYAHSQPVQPLRRALLNGLLVLQQALTQPQLNARLAMERFLVNI